MDTADLHVLRTLRLPDRYEQLEAALGPRVAELLIPPAAATVETLRVAGLNIRARTQGAFGPIVAATGEGKTTLAHAMTTFLPDLYSPCVVHEGPIDSAALTASIERARHPPNDTRIIPLLIDQREGSPPAAGELTEIKRFVRTARLGARTFVLWPETSPSRGVQMARDYEELAGAPPIEMPLKPHGPERDAWRQIAHHTLRLCNEIENLESLGVDPDAYDPAAYSTLGEFLRTISGDFVNNIASIIQANARLLNVVILYPSESGDHGILSHLTTQGRFGMLSGPGLLEATKDSVIGKWWSQRRGLLTQTILKLNAHAFSLPPHLSVAALRLYGPDDIQTALEERGYTKPSPSRVREYLSKTDLGKFLLRKEVSGYETRGRPSETAPEHYASLAKLGFGSGRDKALNKAIGAMLEDFLKAEELPCQACVSEKALPGLQLIPDNTVAVSDNESTCFEYTWRSGDYLTTTNRSEVAQYALKKLQGYALALNWA